MSRAKVHIKVSEEHPSYSRESWLTDRLGPGGTGPTRSQEVTHPQHPRPAPAGASEPVWR